MAKIRKLYDETIKPDGNKTTIYPITSTRAVYTPNSITVDHLLSEGYRFGGVVIPSSVPPITDQRVFYGANTPGVYTSFGGITVDSGEAVFIIYDGTTWSKKEFGGTGLGTLTGYKALSSTTQLPTEETQYGYLIGENLYVWVGQGGDTLGGLYKNCGQLRGASAYEVAVQDGFSGTEEEWLESLKGDRGPKGDPFTFDDFTPEQLTDLTEGAAASVVQNNLDEDDLNATEDDKIQLADRSTSQGQMGYVILRKNKTFAEQVTAANTIYEIRYDFTLAADFTMPAGCVLLFNGGSISGAYTFTGTNTGVVSAITKIFDTSIQIAGTWNIAEAFPEWFGAAGDGVADDTTALKNCFLLKVPSTLKAKYLINQSIRGYNSINGGGASLIYGGNCYLSFQDMADFYIRGLNIDGQSLSSFGLRFNNVRNVVISNCAIENIGNATIAQVSAINFMISSSCKNAVVQNCTIKNVVYDSVGACSGIGFSNNVGDTTTNNYGLYVSNCRFEGFNTSWEDSDCIKILSDNGLDTHVVITGCFFTGIGKRAIKTQARGVKLIGNTYEVVSTVQAVIAFQRGYGESLNDTLIVNPGSGETSEYFLANVFELGYGNINISNFNTIIQNSVNVNGSHMMFANIGGFDETEFKGLRITNCTVGHVGFLLKFTTTTPTSDIDVRNVKFNNPASFHNRFAVNTPSSLTSSKFENIGIINSYAPLSNLDFSKIFNCSLILDCAFAGFGGSNFTTDNGNCIKITYDQTASNVAVLEYATGRIVRAYNYVSTNPGGLGSSKWGALRNAAATVGTILYKNSPTVSGDGTKIEMGYILTSVSGSSIGTTAIYAIPIS